MTASPVVQALAEVLMFLNRLSSIAGLRVAAEFSSLTFTRVQDSSQRFNSYSYPAGTHHASVGGRSVDTAHGRARYPQARGAAWTSVGWTGSGGDRRP
jgi:hypothetical protein